jgi:hypothetical protein
MLGGFIDAAARIGPNPYDLPGADSANQLAAMPSMHVGWAVIVGVALCAAHSNRWVRCVAIVHPLITVAVVVVTAHHFFADVAAGAAFALVAWNLARYFQIRRCVALLTGAISTDRELDRSDSAPRVLVPLSPEKTRES